MKNSISSRMRTLGALALAGTLALTGCAAGAAGPGNGSASEQKYTEEDIQAALKKPTTITYWQWTPGIEKQAKLFQEKYPEITVNVVNVGQGPDEYAKLRTAIKAGKGAPDLAMIEYQFLDSFTVNGSLVDLTAFGAAESKDKYPEWLWSQVDRGKGIYGFPSNAGPMANLYRKDIYDAAGVTTPPATWTEFADAAAKIRETGSYIMTLPGNNAGQTIGYFWQAGAKPFGFDGDKTITVNLDSPEVQKVTDNFQDLLDKGLVDNSNDFTDSWFQGIANGKYASWLTAAWGPVFLDSGTAANTAGSWRVAPLPQWDASKPRSANWGGNGTSIVKGSANPLVAYAFARFLNEDPVSTKMLAFEQSQFPATIAQQEAPDFASNTVPFFGDQEINRVFLDSSAQIDTGFQWLPIMDFVFQSYNETYGKAIADGTNLRAGLTAWQKAIVEYATTQGFTVK
ncbi:extracellular solute-binding protein [Mycetocola tolaasinivorans]|uniref:Extracellular solute-binding protein n=1 Tax=Mycetocola tolaasinivorans TaxID=76635 RepID=A0A3L7A632_9MICO|nr:extracellular solute-binding protein [Mycetocola tolaasinivorans]RLP75505.1 extracellular solute-binding protein [Mycetocola tolaasinivorans]